MSGNESASVGSVMPSTIGKQELLETPFVSKFTLEMIDKNT